MWCNLVIGCFNTFVSGLSFGCGEWTLGIINIIFAVLNILLFVI